MKSFLLDSLGSWRRQWRSAAWMMMTVLLLLMMMWIDRVEMIVAVSHSHSQDMAVSRLHAARDHNSLLSSKLPTFLSSSSLRNDNNNDKNNNNSPSHAASSSSFVSSHPAAPTVLTATTSSVPPKSPNVLLNTAKDSDEEPTYSSQEGLSVPLFRRTKHSPSSTSSSSSASSPAHTTSSLFSTSTRALHRLVAVDYHCVFFHAHVLTSLISL